jgi:RNA polymerase-binding transcription factor DksA
MASDAPPSGSTTTDYAQLLEEERSGLRRQLDDIGFGDAGGLKYDSNFADTSQVTAERGEAEALAGELKEALEEVEAAIGRLALGTYGRCERCGQEITPARLEAMPAARLCIADANRG